MKEGQSEGTESKREYGGGTRHRNFNYAIPYNYIIYLETSIFAFSIVLTVEIAGGKREFQSSVSNAGFSREVTFPECCR